MNPKAHDDLDHSKGFLFALLALIPIWGVIIGLIVAFAKILDYLFLG